MFNFIKRFLYKRKVSRLVDKGVVPLLDITLLDKESCVMCVAALLFLCKTQNKALLEINSSGGFLNNGFAIIDILREYKDLITVRCADKAAGAAFLILMSGFPGNRLTSRCANLMFTPISAELNHKDDHQFHIEAKKLMDEIITMTSANGHSNRSEVIDWLNSGRVFTPEQAKYYNFIDVIIEHG